MQDISANFLSYRPEGGGLFAASPLLLRLPNAESAFHVTVVEIA
jgi:hypothetical protein